MDLAVALAQSCCGETRFRYVLFTSLLALAPRCLVGHKTMEKLDDILSSKNLRFPYEQDKELTAIRMGCDAR
jgi:hypothetical protein